MAFSFPPAAAAAPPPVAAQWYYYLTNDPQGYLQDGWYAYDMNLNTTVEQLYQQNVQASAASPSKRARHLVPFTAISGYRYELDFQQMTQRNTQSGKQRPIARTTNGMPPTAAPTNGIGGGFAAAAMAALGAAVAPPAAAAAPPPAPARSRRNRRSSGSGAAADGTVLRYTAPERLHEIHVDEAKVFDDVSPPSNNKQEEKKQDATEEDDCVICLDSLWGSDEKKQCRVVSLKGCGHKFHYDCIHEALTKAGAKCPLCSKAIHQQQSNSTTSKGKCPSGTMSIRVDTRRNCSGHDGGTITIQYNIQGGVQKDYHQNPGQSFSGASRTAYLPNNPQGLDLLERMKYAFLHGLSFMVGTSLTTGQPNVVTWSSIHHKTSMHGGTFGYPDDTYFDRCNDELNSLGVPGPAECRTWLQNHAP